MKDACRRSVRVGGRKRDGKRSNAGVVSPPLQCRAPPSPPTAPPSPPTAHSPSRGVVLLGFMRKHICHAMLGATLSSIACCAAQERGNCAPVQGALLADGVTADPCLFECISGAKLHRFHLEPVLESAGAKGYLEAVGTGSSADTYYFGACGVVRGVTCVSAKVTGKAAAIQAYGGGLPPRIDGECAVLGHDQNRNCSLVPPPPSESVVPPSMLCKYVGGTGGRVLQVDYKCMPGAPMNLKAESTGVSAMAGLCRQRLLSARR